MHVGSHLVRLKTPGEIGLMREAGIVNWHAHQLAAGMVAPGVTTAQIDEAVERFFRQQRVVPLFKGVAGRVPFPAVTCISVNEAVVHGIPGDRVLRTGDVVSIDTGCRKNGWCADSAVTLPVGPISDEAQRLLDVTRQTLELAIELMAVKRFWREVAAEMEQFVRDQRFSVVENFVGHGIGRAMHEAPQVPNFVSKQLRGQGNFELRPGLVIAVEPMVNVGTKDVRATADHWTLVTADGSYSAHFEHTVAITDEGPKVLTASASGKY